MTTNGNGGQGDGPGWRSAYLDRGIETCGLWIPVLVTVPFLFDLNHFPSIFWSAFGSGSLLAAGALIALSFLATPGANARTIALILGYIVVSFAWHSQLLERSADANSAANDVQGMGEVALTVVIFLGVATLRTLYLLKERGGWGPDA